MSREYLPYYPYDFELDDERVRIHIKRMSYAEFQDFHHRSAELEKTVLEEHVFRDPTGSEQERDAEGNFVISWDELCHRRLREMPPEKRAELEAAQRKRLKDQDDFIAECIERFIVHVEPGLVAVHHDGSKHPIVDGKGLLQITGGRRTVHLELYQAIFSENFLNEEQKKSWKSRRGSSTSSTGPDPARAGQKPGTTAGNAASSGSAGNGAAPRRRRRPSGSGGRRKGSSPGAVPSSH